MNSNMSYRIIAFSLAMLILLTSSGLTLDMHMCQGNLKSFSLFGKAKSCVELAQKKQCHKTKKSCHEQISSEKKTCKKGCCDNISTVIKLSTDLVEGQTALYSAQNLQFAAVFVYTYFGFTDYKPSPHYFQHYKPPLLNRDIPVLIQSFLI